MRATPPDYETWPQDKKNKFCAAEAKAYRNATRGNGLGEQEATGEVSPLTRGRKSASSLSRSPKSHSTQPRHILSKGLSRASAFASSGGHPNAASHFSSSTC
jgi:hypothetical protein